MSSKLPSVANSRASSANNNNNINNNVGMSSGETVTVRTWTLHVLSIEVSVSDTIATLKDSIRDVFGTDVASQVLSCQGRVLHNHLLISECRLGRGSLVHLNMTAQSAASMRVFCPGGLAVADQLEAAPLNCHLFIFDMDDTLTRNGVLAPGIRPLLEKLLKDGHFLAIASFNRSAVEILRMNGIDHLFHVIACGWNVRSRKTQHIRHCFRVLGWTDDTPRVAFFFDDQVDNIRDVRRELSPPGNVQAVFVSAVRQMPSLVAQALDTALQFERERATTVTRTNSASSPMRQQQSTSSSPRPPVPITASASGASSSSPSASSASSPPRMSLALGSAGRRDSESSVSSTGSSAPPLPSPGSSLRRRIAAAAAAAASETDADAATAGTASTTTTTTTSTTSAASPSSSFSNGPAVQRNLANLRINANDDDLNSTSASIASGLDTPKNKSTLLMSVTVNAKTHAALVGDIDTSNGGAATNSSRRGPPNSTTTTHHHHPPSKKGVPVLEGGATVEEDESGNSSAGSRSCPNLGGFGLEFPDSLDFESDVIPRPFNTTNDTTTSSSHHTTTSSNAFGSSTGSNDTRSRSSSSAAGANVDPPSPIANKQQSHDKFHRASISSGAAPSIHPGTSESPQVAMMMMSASSSPSVSSSSTTPDSSISASSILTAKVRGASVVSKSGSLVSSTASRARIAIPAGNGLSATNSLRNSMQ